MTTEHDEGFAAGIEAAIRTINKRFPNAHTYASENADLYRAQDTIRDSIVDAIRALKPAPRSAEHTAKPSAQERERFEALLRELDIQRKRYDDGTSSFGQVKDAYDAVLAAFGALAAAPSTRKLDEMIEMQRNACDCVNDDYFRGLINGMILAKSIIEGGDEEPKFVSKPDAAPSTRIETEPVAFSLDAVELRTLQMMHVREHSRHLGAADEWASRGQVGSDMEKRSRSLAESHRLRADVFRAASELPTPPDRTPDARSTSDAAVVLPELPKAVQKGWIFTAEQMRAYATAAVLADRATRSTDSSAEATIEAFACAEETIRPFKTARCLRWCGNDVSCLISRQLELTPNVATKAMMKEGSRALYHELDGRAGSEHDAQIVYRAMLNAWREESARTTPAEAAKLTTAPHTADETRVDGGAT